MDNPHFIRPANPLAALRLGFESYDAEKKKAAFEAIGKQISEKGSIDGTAIGHLFGLGPTPIQDIFNRRSTR